MKIQKKTTDNFDKILSGEKTFEVRLADWKCKKGDILILREWDPKKKIYTGRKVEKRVTVVIKTKNCNYWPKEDIEKYGFQIIGLE